METNIPRAWQKFQYANQRCQATGFIPAVGKTYHIEAKWAREVSQ
jgi:hypothetical protein